MVNVGGGYTDRLEKRGHEIETILGGVEKPLVIGDLVPGTSASGDTIGG